MATNSEAVERGSKVGHGGQNLGGSSGITLALLCPGHTERARCDGRVL
jgi:hypothetical protein